MNDLHGGTTSFILQEDNCGPHRAKSMATYLANKDESRMKCPVQRLDLNPIEYLWGLIKAQLRRRSTYPSNTTLISNPDWYVKGTTRLLFNYFGRINA